MSRVYVRNLDARVSVQELEDEFQNVGVIRHIRVAREPQAMALSTLITIEMLKMQFMT